MKNKSKAPQDHHSTGMLSEHRTVHPDSMIRSPKAAAARVVHILSTRFWNLRTADRKYFQIYSSPLTPSIMHQDGFPTHKNSNLGNGLTLLSTLQIRCIDVHHSEGKIKKARDKTYPNKIRRHPEVQDLLLKSYFQKLLVSLTSSMLSHLSSTL